MFLEKEKKQKQKTNKPTKQNRQQQQQQQNKTKRKIADLYLNNHTFSLYKKKKLNIEKTFTSLYYVSTFTAPA